MKKRVGLCLFLVLVGLVGMVGAMETGSITGDFIYESDRTAYYPLDGDVKDYSGYGNDGTEPIERREWNDGLHECPKESCLSLDGVEDFFRVNEISNLNAQSFSVGAWVKPKLKQKYQTIISSWEVEKTFILRINNLDKFEFVYFDGKTRELEAPTKISDSDWYYVVGVYSKEGIKVFVNGEKAAERGWITDLAYEFGRVWIGKQALPEMNYLEGRIDEISVYNYALGDDVVMREYLKTRAESCGDDFVSKELGEECDDGNHVSGDGCDRYCYVDEVESVEDGGEMIKEGGVEKGEDVDEEEKGSNLIGIIVVIVIVIIVIVVLFVKKKSK